MNRIDFVTVKPVEGRRVRKPDGTLLAAEGERVQRNSFWLRREKDGDVTLESPKGEEPPKPAAKTKAAAATAAAGEDSKK